jgi:hypothetical protein
MDRSCDIQQGSRWCYESGPNDVAACHRSSQWASRDVWDFNNACRGGFKALIGDGGLSADNERCQEKTVDVKYDENENAL